MMKDNKLIAEFMGWKRGTNEETNTNQFFLAQPDNWYLKDESELQFHSSWDWLIPVILEIEVKAYRLNLPQLDVSFYDEIHEVYWAVLEFIKKYNDEK